MEKGKDRLYIEELEGGREDPLKTINMCEPES